MGRRPLARPPRARPRRPDDAGHALVPGRHPQLRRARPRPAAPAPTTSPSSPAQTPDRADPHLGRAARGGRPVPRRPAPPRRGPRRPGGRARPQHPRDARRLPRHRQPRRDLVVVRAGVRRPRGASTGSRRSSRWCWWPSTATATAASDLDRRSEVDDASRRAARRCATSCWCPTSTRGRDRTGRCLGRAHRRGRPARVRAGPVRPPAVRPVLVGDDRAAQGDRPRPRRHRPRAPEGARACTRTSAPATGSPGSPPPAG